MKAAIAWSILAVATAAAVPAPTTGIRHDVSSCRTDSFNVKVFRTVVLATAPNVPSALRDTLGMTTIPADADVVSSIQTCDSVLQAYNGLVASIDTTWRLDSAVILRTGNIFWLPLASDPDTLYYQKYFAIRSDFTYMTWWDTPQ